MSEALSIDRLIGDYRSGTLTLPALACAIADSKLTFGHCGGAGKCQWVAGSWDAVRCAHNGGRLTDGEFATITAATKDAYPDEVVW
jgi:hypothetical protein